MKNQEGVWLSITDYSQYRKVSISTIRRHIKSNTVKWRETDGKYFIYAPSVDKIQKENEVDLMKLKLEVESLRQKLQTVLEENAELKMLVQLYEKKPEITYHLHQ